MDSQCHCWSSVSCYILNIVICFMYYIVNFFLHMFNHVEYMSFISLFDKYDIHLFPPYLVFSFIDPPDAPQGIEESAGKEGEADNIAGKIESLGCYRIRGRKMCATNRISGRCWKSQNKWQCCYVVELMTLDNGLMMFDVLFILVCMLYI